MPVFVEFHGVVRRVKETENRTGKSAHPPEQ